MNILDLVKDDYWSTKIKDCEYGKLIQDREKLEKDIYAILQSEGVELLKKYTELIDRIIAFQIDYTLEFSYAKIKQIIKEMYS